MPPRDRRRARARSRARAAPILVVLGLLAFFLIGGVIKIGSSSGPFKRSVDGSFAAQGSVVAQDSNRSSASLLSLVAGLDASRTTRPELEVSLAALARQTTSQLSALQAISPPSPGEKVMADLVGAFALRARAVGAFRSTLDALLQMARLSGSSSTSGVTASASSARLPAPITTVSASSQLSSVGSLLAASDSAYARARRMLAELPGSARLIGSRWVRDPASWGAQAVATLVTRVSASPLLGISRRLTLVTTRLDPGAVPSTTSSGPVAVPPTTRLTVTAVVGNEGNVAESNAHVSATLQPLGPGASATSGRTVSLAPGASVAEIFAPLRVRPGDSYTLTISLVPPDAQPATSVLAISTPLRVAPTAPPTTTTTVPPSTTAATTTTTGATSTTTAPHPATTRKRG